MPFPDPEGRIRHAMDVMHRAETGDNPPEPIPEGWVVSTDGAGLVGWVPPGDVAGDATTIDTVGGGSGLPGDTVQEDLDYLANLIGLVGTGGTLTAGGSPVAVTNDSSYNAFPGLGRLSAGRVLIAYRKGTDHASTNDGRIVGKIGTLAADFQSVASWGTEFEIYNHATLDVRCEDAVAVIDGQVWVSGRHYDGSDNQLPFVMLCDDAADALSSTSTWTKHDITMAQGADQNYTQGHLLKIADGTYLQPVGWDTAGTHTTGAALVTDPTDWSAPTFETIFSGADYAEIGIEMWPDGTLRAHGNRAAGAGSHYWSESTDNAATWSAPAVLFAGIGYPAFRRLPSGLHLSVYRTDAGSEDAAWREGDIDDANYSAETILDTTGSQMEYATILALTRTTALVAYGVQNSGTDADIRTQLFSDDSVFSISIAGTDELVKVSADDTTAGYLNGKLVAGTGITLTEGSPGGNETLTIAATGGGGAVPTGILLESDHATPFAFDEILQASDGSDFLWESE